MQPLSQLRGEDFRKYVKEVTYLLAALRTWTAGTLMYLLWTLQAQDMLYKPCLSSSSSDTSSTVDLRYAMCKRNWCDFRITTQRLDSWKNTGKYDSFVLLYCTLTNLSGEENVDLRQLWTSAPFHFSDTDFLFDVLPACTRKRLWQAQQPLPRPYTRSWCHTDGALSTPTHWACGMDQHDVCLVFFSTVFPQNFLFCKSQHTVDNYI